MKLKEHSQSNQVHSNHQKPLPNEENHEYGSTPTQIRSKGDRSRSAIWPSQRFWRCVAVSMAVSRHLFEQVIPPRQNAKIKHYGNSKRPRLERDEAIRNIRKYGHKGWKRRIGYHRRSRAEIVMFRMKTQLQWPIEKPAHRKSKNRSENKMQNNQPLHKTGAAKIFNKKSIGNNADPKGKIKFFCGH
jgi:hypothetical protein